ncbi:MAG TPA: glycosyl hydrolase family 28-related protein [Crenalkalicoccus sp.]|nr:glycosyl hydrolase family 28-related protein [Crenalkalicoccus sp.]
MPDARISELPAANALSDGDLAPLVQGSGASLVTRRASFAQLRAATLTDRGVHVRDYGAKGDGATDDAPAIQAAINDVAGKGGGTILFGPRRYRLASAVTINGVAVRLQGQGFTEAPGPADGTWLVVDQTGFTPFTFTGVAARGSAVRDIAVFQQHPGVVGGSWAPANYPYVFVTQDCLGGVDFDNLFLCAVNRGIYSSNSGRLDIRRLRGQVFTAGVELDQCLDVPRLHSLHFWPFWGPDNTIIRWQQANGDAMIFRRCDGAFLDQAFALGYRSMFRFSSSASGVTTKFYIGNAYADFVQYGVWVEASGTDGQIANLTTQGELFGSGGTPLTGAIGLYVAGSNTRVHAANLRVDTTQNNAVRVEGAGNRLDIASLRCVRFNQQNNGSAAIHIADSGAGTPNAVFLGSLPLLETGNGGPLLNSPTNGVLTHGGPAGVAARPGLSVGATDTGLFQPAASALAASAGGAEVLRATGAGSVTLGATPGSHALEVATPGATLNRLLVTGGTMGSAVTLQAAGADANIALSLAPKGTGALLVNNAGGGNVARISGSIASPTTLNPVVIGVDASSADTNVAVVLGNPKGNGYISAQLPDNAATGGNPRGTGAVDWQTTRNTAAQIALGPNSVIAGGQRNQVNGANAVVGGGQANSANAASAAVAGGQNNTASGQYSWVPGGFQADTRSTYGKGAFGSGNFSISGDAQAGEHVLRQKSTDATAQRLTSDSLAPGTSNSVILPANGTYLVRVMAIARQTGGTAGTQGDSAAWDVTALVKRGVPFTATTLVAGGGASLAPSLNDAAAAAWRLTIAADTTNGSLAVSGTGEANKTLYWVARVLSVEAVG